MIPPDSDTMLTAAISTTLIYIIISSSIMKATELSSSLIRLLQKKITRGIAADCCTGIIVLRRGRERETERVRLFFY